MTTFLLDLKRLISGGKSILIMVLAPALLIFCFSLSISANFFSGEIKPFVIALNNQDDHPQTQMIVSSLVENEGSRGLVNIEHTLSDEQGQELLKQGAAALISIPENFQNDLLSGKQAVFNVAYNPDTPLAANLIDGILKSGINLINTAQRSVNAIYYTLGDNGYPATQAFNESANKLFADAFLRNLVFDVQSEQSPFSQLLPIEFYACSLIAIFIILGSLSVGALANHDLPSLPIHYLSGRNSVYFLSTKIFSGAVYLTILAIPTTLLCLIIMSANITINGLLLNLLSIFAMSLMVSAIAVCLACFAKNMDECIKVSFIFGCGLIALGGLIIPVSFFGKAGSFLAFTPAAAGAKALSVIFYDISSELFICIAVMCVYTLSAFAIGALTIKKRGI